MGLVATGNANVVGPFGGHLQAVGDQKLGLIGAGGLAFKGNGHLTYTGPAGHVFHLLNENNDFALHPATSATLQALYVPESNSLLVL